MNTTSNKEGVNMETKNIHVSNRNSKIGAIPNWSLTPIDTCPNCNYCFQKDLGLECYAVKAYKQYPNTKIAWDENYQIARGNLPLFKDQMVTYLKKCKSDVFRIHVAGDFFNQEYLNAWIDICERFPNIKFLAFTKAFHLNYKLIPDNLKIIFSVMPNMDTSWIPTGYSRAYAGKCETKSETIFNCHGHCDQCGICWELKADYSVQFEIH